MLLPFNSSPEKWSEISNFILEFTRINGAGRLSRRAHSGTTRYPRRGRCREIGERGHSWRRSYFDDSVEKPTVTPLSLDSSTLNVGAHTILSGSFCTLRGMVASRSPRYQHSRIRPVHYFSPSIRLPLPRRIKMDSRSSFLRPSRFGILERRLTVSSHAKIRVTVFGFKWAPGIWHFQRVDLIFLWATSTA